MTLPFDQCVHSLKEIDSNDEEHVVEANSQNFDQQLNPWRPFLFSAASIAAEALRRQRDLIHANEKIKQWSALMESSAERKTRSVDALRPHICEVVEKLTQPDPGFSIALTALEKIVERAKTAAAVAESLADAGGFNPTLEYS